MKLDIFNSDTTDIKRMLSKRFGITISETLDRSTASRMLEKIAEQNMNIKKKHYGQINTHKLYNENLLLKTYLTKILKEDTAPSIMGAPKPTNTVQKPMDQATQVKKDLIAKKLKSGGGLTQTDLKQSFGDKSDEEIDAIATNIAQKKPMSEAMNTYDIKYKTINNKFNTKIFMAESEEKAVERLLDVYPSVKPVQVTLIKKPTPVIENRIRDANRLKNSFRLFEDTDIQNAELILAAKDIVNQIQGMIEKLSSIQNKDLPALTDSIKDGMDLQRGTDYGNAVNKAIGEALTALQGVRSETDTAARTLAGERVEGNGGGMGDFMQHGPDDEAAGLDPNEPKDMDMGDHEPDEHGLPKIPNHRKEHEADLEKLAGREKR